MNPRLTQPHRREAGQPSYPSFKPLDSKIWIKTHNTLFRWGPGDHTKVLCSWGGHGGPPWPHPLPAAPWWVWCEVNGREQVREASKGRPSVTISWVSLAIPPPTCLFSPDWTALVCLPSPRRSREPLEGEGTWEIRELGVKFRRPSVISCIVAAFDPFVYWCRCVHSRDCVLPPPRLLCYYFLPSASFPAFHS